VTAGDLAERALRRLRSTPSKRPTPFTSDLSVDELVLVEEAGLEPVQLVMGSGVVSVLPRTIYRTGELRYATDALYRARGRAIDDLRREARRLGADGVVGVRVEIDAERWGEHLHEFVAIGTAVRGRTGRFRIRRGPFTSHLTGQGLYALIAAGHRPMSLVMGASVWGVSRWSAVWWLAARRGVELSRLTRELTTARERAIRRMGNEARAVGASGVVGITIEQRAHAWGGSAMEFLALGTAVRPRDDGIAAAPPRTVVPVDAPAPRAAEIRVDVAPWRRVSR
jgi:uncharacterized protein YbjQ (UPF0145 family)